MSLSHLQQTVLSRAYERAHYVLFPLVVAEGLLFVFYGDTNADEGWCLYTARLVFEGDIPYRDFPYFQGPLLPYLYGLPQLLLGPSVLVGRFTSLVFTLTTVLVVAYLAHRLAGRMALLWALALMIANPMLMFYGILARPEAAVTALSVLALAALLRFRQGTPALLVGPALLLLASGTRIVFMAAFLGVLAFAWWTTRASRGQSLLAGGALISEAAVIFGVPLVLAPGRAVFGLWSSQVSRTNQWAPSDLSAGETLLAKLAQLDDIWSAYLMLLVPAVALGAYLILRYYRGWQPGRASLGGDPLDSYLLVLGLAFVVFAPHMMLSPIHLLYFVPGSALLTVVVAAGAARLPGATEPPAVRTNFVLLLLAPLVLLGAPFYGARSTDFLDVRNPSLVKLGDIGDLLAGHLDEDAPFVAFDTSLAVAADRPVLRGLEMAHFSYWPSFSTDEAEDLQVFNRERLLQVIERDAPQVVAFTSRDLALIELTTLPDQLGAPEEELPFQTLPELKRWYSLADIVPRYREFQGDLYILVRRSVPLYSPSEP